jgi:ATP-binding cassette subfamily B protein
LRDNVAPSGAPDEVIKEALAQAGLRIWRTSTHHSRKVTRRHDLSGGQWQRIAGAGVVRVHLGSAGAVG